MKTNEKVTPQSGGVGPRDKSGYFRDFNIWHVFIINVLGFSIGLAFSTNPPYIAGLAPGAWLAAVFGIGALIALVSGVVYGFFGGIMPSTGGDYVYISRTFGGAPFLGFIASWGFTVTQCFGIAFNLVAAFTFALAPALMTAGDPFLSGASVTGLNLAKGSVPYVAGFASLAGVALLTLSGITLKRVFLFTLFAAGIASVVSGLLILGSCDHSSFVAAFNKFAVDKLAFKGANAYESVLSAARDAGAQLPQRPSLSSAWSVVPLGFLAFVGFNYSVYMGGEVREPLRSQVRGIGFALLCGVCSFIGLSQLYDRAVGVEFQAALYYGDTATKVLGLPVMPPVSSSLLVGIAAQSKPILNVVFQVGNVIWFFMVPVVIFHVCIRNIVAWSRDRVFFRLGLSRTKERGVAWGAAVITTIFATGWMTGNLIYGASLLGAAVLLAVPMALSGAAAVVLPLADSNGAWKRAPELVKRPIAGIPLFQLCGALTVISALAIAYFGLKLDGAFSGQIGKVTGYLVGVYVPGALLYAYFKKKRDAAGGGGGDITKVIPAD